MNFTKAILAFFIVLSFISAACTATTPTAKVSTNANQAVVANQNSNQIAAANITTASPAPIQSPASAANLAAGSPSATVAAYHQAMLKKDEMTFRKTLSAATLNEFGRFAKEEGSTSLLEYWTGFSSPAARLQVRNEQIQGDAAIIEIGNDENVFTKHRLVREKGEWKLDLTEATFRQLK